MTVGDLNVLDVHGERSLVPLGEATSPLNGTFWGVLATADPIAELDLHWGLGEVLAAVGIVVAQVTDLSTIDEPLEILGSPLNLVSVEVVLWVGDWVVQGTVVGGGVALAVVVGLDGDVVVANPLPIDLVEGGRLKDKGGDDSLAVRGLHRHLDGAEEDVPWRLDRWGVGLFADGELGSVLAVRELGAWEVIELLAGSLGKVDVEGGTKCDLGWTGWMNVSYCDKSSGD